MLFEVILAFWGCMSELDPSCTRDVFDMTNAASTWVGLIAGAGIGAVITWWVYFRQKMISKQQDDLLEKVKVLVEKNVNLEESHEKMLKSIEEFQKHHETVLNQILHLDKKIDHLLKK